MIRRRLSSALLLIVLVASSAPGLALTTAGPASSTARPGPAGPDFTGLLDSMAHAVTSAPHAHTALTACGGRACGGADAVRQPSGRPGRTR